MALQPAFPQHKSRPPHALKLAKALKVPRPVSRDFALPIVKPGLGHPTEPTFVPMPKTAVHKDHFAPGAEDHIRPSWQVLPVKPVSVTHAVNKMTHHPLWLGVL